MKTIFVLIEVEQKKAGATLDLMAMCEEVDFDETHLAADLGVPEDTNKILKRVQIKLEHGTGISQSTVPAASVELTPTISSHMHHQENQSATEFLTTQEEVVIHQESLEMEDDQHSCDGAATTSVSV